MQNIFLKVFFIIFLDFLLPFWSFFLTELFVVLLLSLKFLCIFWVTIFYHICHFQIISPSLWLVFLFCFTVPFFKEQKNLTLMKSFSLILYSGIMYFVQYLKRYFKTHDYLDFLLHYLLLHISFYFSILRTKIHSEITFLCVICATSSFSF